MISSVLICASGGASGVHHHSQLVDAEKIIICCGNEVFNLSIPNLKVNWMIKADQITCFEVFKLKQDFIIHGELAISRILNDGKIIWQRSGAAIFTTIDSKEEDFK